jgi:hypothetical protein
MVSIFPALAMVGPWKAATNTVGYGKVWLSTSPRMVADTTKCLCAGNCSQPKLADAKCYRSTVPVEKRLLPETATAPRTHVLFSQSPEALHWPSQPHSRTTVRHQWPAEAGCDPAQAADHVHDKRNVTMHTRNHCIRIAICGLTWVRGLAQCKGSMHPPGFETTGRQQRRRLRRRHRQASSGPAPRHRSARMFHAPVDLSRPVR